MVGGVGGGDADAPINGGEFLLQLLKNPPQHPRTPSPSLSQPLPHDPAVAAVGPSIPFSSSSSRPLLFPPHNYFNQGLGFPQNPTFLQPPLPPPHQHITDHLSKLGLIHTNHHQDPPKNLLFGSLQPDLRPSKPHLDYDRPTVRKHTELSSLTFGNYVSSSTSQQQARRMPPPPPGFGIAIGKRNSEHSMDDAISPESFNLGAPSTGGGTHLHDPNQNRSTNNALHSPQLDHLEQQPDNLLLEDGTDDSKKGPKSRDKDYRSDKRGQWILNQRMRNQRSHIECRRDINRLNAHFLEIFESLIPPKKKKVPTATLR